MEQARMETPSFIFDKSFFANNGIAVETDRSKNRSSSGENEMSRLLNDVNNLKLSSCQCESGRESKEQQQIWYYNNKIWSELSKKQDSIRFAETYRNLASKPEMNSVQYGEVNRLNSQKENSNCPTYNTPVEELTGEDSRHNRQSSNIIDYSADTDESIVKLNPHLNLPFQTPSRVNPNEHSLPVPRPKDGQVPKWKVPSYSKEIQGMPNTPVINPIVSMIPRENNIHTINLNSLNYTKQDQLSLNQGNFSQGSSSNTTLYYNCVDNGSYCTPTKSNPYLTGSSIPYMNHFPNFPLNPGGVGNMNCKVFPVNKSMKSFSSYYSSKNPNVTTSGNTEEEILSNELLRKRKSMNFEIPTEESLESSKSSLNHNLVTNSMTPLKTNFAKVQPPVNSLNSNLCYNTASNQDASQVSMMKLRNPLLSKRSVYYVSTMSSLSRAQMPLGTGQFFMDSQSSNASVTEKFDINFEEILKGKEARTTVMIRNIPNRYTVEQLLEEIDDYGFKGKYDCFYLPEDPTVSALT